MSPVRRSVLFACALSWLAATGVADEAPPEYGWRDMLRDYLALRAAGTDCTGEFKGFDPDLARLGEAFARRAYPKNPALGRANFRRLVTKLGLEHPGESRRLAFFTPNKSPWDGYAGPVDEDDGLFHFLFNTGTLPMPLLSHPIVSQIRRHDVGRDRVKPIAQCAARVLRRESADLSLVERDAAARSALVAKIRRVFDIENAGEPMSDEEARCLAACLDYMA